MWESSFTGTKSRHTCCSLNQNRPGSGPLTHERSRSLMRRTSAGGAYPGVRPGLEVPIKTILRFTSTSSAAFSPSEKRIRTRTSNRRTHSLNWFGLSDLRMRILLLCVLVLLLSPGSEELLLIKTRWRPRQTEQNKMQNLKRHTDGTFSSDFTRYLDKIKAKNFVEWLARTKQGGCHEDVFHMSAEI